MRVHLLDGTYELFRQFFGQPPRAADEVRWSRLSTLVRPVAPGVWRFGHDLFRQTIYEAVSYRRRRANVQLCGRRPADHIHTLDLQAPASPLGPIF